MTHGSWPFDMTHTPEDNLWLVISEGFDNRNQMNPRMFSIYKPVGNELFGHRTIKQIVLIMTRFNKVKFKRYNETIINHLKWDPY